MHIILEISTSCPEKCEHIILALSKEDTLSYINQGLIDSENAELMRYEYRQDFLSSTDGAS
jgi:hypothetical protein